VARRADGHRTPRAGGVSARRRRSPRPSHLRESGLLLYGGGVAPRRRPPGAYLIYKNAKAPAKIAAVAMSMPTPAPVASPVAVSPPPKTTPTPGATATASPVPATARPNAHSPRPVVRATGHSRGHSSAPHRARTAKWLAEAGAAVGRRAYATEISGPFEEKRWPALRQAVSQTCSNSRSRPSPRPQKLVDAVAFRRRSATAWPPAAKLAADDEPTAPASLKTLHASYRTALAKLQADRLARAKAFHARYDTVLQQNQKRAHPRRIVSTKRSRMKARREALSAAWLQTGHRPSEASGREQRLDRPPHPARSRPTVAQYGNGWSLKNGQLASPGREKKRDPAAARPVRPAPATRCR